MITGFKMILFFFGEKSVLQLKQVKDSETSGVLTGVYLNAFKISLEKDVTFFFGIT
jgi:hypothetical protein